MSGVECDDALDLLPKVSHAGYKYIQTSNTHHNPYNKLHHILYNKLNARAYSQLLTLATPFLSTFLFLWHSFLPPN